MFQVLQATVLTLPEALSRTFEFGFSYGDKPVRDCNSFVVQFIVYIHYF